MNRLTSSGPFIALAAAALLLPACGAPDQDPPRAETIAEDLDPSALLPAAQSNEPYTNISPEELAALTGDDDYLVINVHVPYEGEIPGTDLDIPFDEIESHLDDLPAPQDATIVLYCRSGRMSQIAARTLASRGYSDLLHLEGGMIAWEGAGHALEDRALEQ